MLTPIQNSPIDLTGVSLGKECRLTFCIQELENLAIRAGVAAAMARVDLIPAEAAQLDLHDGGRRAGKDGGRPEVGVATAARGMPGALRLRSARREAAGC